MAWPPGFHGKTHNAQMLGATHSKQEFGREEAYEKLKQRISSTENMGDKDSSSLDRKPQQKNCTSVCFLQILSHFGSGGAPVLTCTRAIECFLSISP